MRNGLDQFYHAVVFLGRLAGETIYEVPIRRDVEP